MSHIKTSIKCSMAVFIMMVAFCVTGITAQAANVAQTAQTKNSVTINWSAPTISSSSTVLEYYVSIASSSSEANNVTPITVPATTRAYTFNGLSEGTAYYVRVQYKYRTSYGSEYTSYMGGMDIKTLPGQVKNVKQKRWWYYLESVDFSWTTQTGVDGYEYVVKDNKNKTVTTNSTYRTSDTGSSKVSNKKVYTVKVRSYVTINNQKYYGDWSNSAYLFTQPMVKSAKVSGNKLKITWNKVSGVTGYDVYVSTKEKTGYKKVKSVSKSKSSLTVSKLKGKKFNPKKTYYIYIVGKKKVGKTTYTSGRHYSYSIKNGFGKLHWTFD